ncbi:MAG: contractile injection system protein, VgrG/Pvc8 family [Gammaproteobacteria bacterium]|nr:contractile injection system protein, VgrG/Pvc8 family [Gammaproteobacteria bacterium]MDH5651688.1 contractile injection system protein, VgrG/Pvc8 family [Gammaproteobacteria bacterium]
MKPKFSIKILGGNNVTERVKDRLLSLRITDNVGLQSDSMELVMDDRDAQIATPVPGTQFEVALGYEGDQSLQHVGLFTYDETEFDLAAGTMTIRARADDFRSSYKSPRSRSFHNVRLGDILVTIARDNEYTVQVDPALGNKLVEHLDQLGESDMNLVTRLSKKYGAVLKVTNNELTFSKSGDDKDKQDTVTTTITPVDVSACRVTRIDRTHWGSVIAKYYDTRQAAPQLVKYGDGAPELTLPMFRANKSEADAAAKSTFKEQERARATLNISLPGRSNLQANQILDMQGWRDGVNGKWLITRVQHTLDNSGYHCDVDAEVIK